MGGDLVRDAVEVDPLDHPGEAQAVVAVEVRDADPVQVVGGDPGAQHLALGALAGVEQDALAVPAQQVAVVVAVPGRDLARGAEDDEFAYGHGGWWSGPVRAIRGPFEAAAAEHVGVRVPDGLAGAAAGVEDGAVAVQLLVVGDGLGLAQHVGGELRGLGGEGGGVLVVRLGDHQDMGGGLGVDVPERDGGVRLADDRRGNLPCDDLAEQTVVLGFASHLALLTPVIF